MKYSRWKFHGGQHHTRMSFKVILFTIMKRYFHLSSIICYRRFQFPNYKNHHKFNIAVIRDWIDISRGPESNWIILGKSNISLLCFSFVSDNRLTDLLVFPFTYLSCKDWKVWIVNLINLTYCFRSLLQLWFRPFHLQ